MLAPSEDKVPGGPIGRLVETPAQRWARERLVDLVVHGSAEAQKKAFEVKDAALDKAKAEALALKGPVHLLPALARYSGVAFEALDAASLPRELWSRVFVLSNLRGLVRGDEPVPPYKLKLSGLPGLKAHWRKALPPLLAKLPEGETWELLPQDAADLLKGWDRPR
ncbi:MAG TPA: peroxide stress protein YaaA, partial [Holophagaceae bacterium]|nr:peroxide stress protein YaaA [Holophagaceae bacterium]